LESVEEARTLNAIAEPNGRTMRISLRINPKEGAGGAMRMGGCPSPFGIDEEELDSAIEQILPLSHVQIVGVHLFMGTQILAAETLLEQYERAVTLARYVASRLPHALRTIDFGGGWGTPYFAHEGELDLPRVATGLARIARHLEGDRLLQAATGILEPGRFLVNEAGVYLAQVTRVKRSRGKVFAILDGGMHHHLAASGNLGQTIKRNYPVAVVNKLGRPASETVEVVGPLCTPLDVLARKAALPVIEAGDLFGVFQSGAYARTSSPLGFLSHPAPAEVLVDADQATLIRRRGEREDFLRDQCREQPVTKAR